MRTLTRSKAVVALTTGLVLAGGGIAAADDIGNNLDASLDAAAEVMPLNVGGVPGKTTLFVTPRNGDGKNGCNLTGSTSAAFSLASSAPAVATVSPTAVTFTSCDQTHTLTITPLTVGSTTISAAQTANTTGGTFNLAPTTFTVNVVPPPNSAPTISVGGVSGGASYSKGSVPAATCQVTDAEDGNSSFPAALSAITGPYASDGIGSQTASCDYMDGGGLTASASETYSIIDPSPPSISRLLNPASPDGDNGWYRSDVTLDWTVTEPQSPNSLQLVGCVDQNITADQVATLYECAATSAGGAVGPESVTIGRDASAPVVSGSDVNNTTWRNTAQSENFTSSDATSGLADTSDTSFTLTASDESADAVTPTTVSRTVFDNAGNSTTRTLSALIDKTAPGVAVTGVVNGGIYTLGSVPTAGCSTSDALSGVAQAASVATTGTIGTVTTSCSGAQDNAGNPGSASVTYSVRYAFSGFFQPIDNNGVYNKAKAGSTIPVKFSLGGNQGLSIFTAQTPTATRVACPTAAPLDTIEEVVTATTSGLKYDAASGQYIYNWKTTSAMAGTCQRLTVSFADGTSQTAFFNLTR